MKFTKILKAGEIPNRVFELLQESYQEDCKPLAYLSTRGGKTEIVISQDKFGINITTYINGKSQSNDNGITDLASHWNKYYSNSINKEFGQSLYKLIWSDPLLDTTIFTEMKKESAIQQPNKPKPTTTLPDNMQWAWDPNAVDWVAVLKDNSVTTPPLYDPNNQNVVNQNTNYMSNVKSASEKSMMDLAQNIIHDVVLIHKAKSMDSRTEWDGTFAILTLNPEKTDVIDIKYVPQSSLPSYTPNDNEYGLVRTRDTGFDETDYQLQPLEMIIRQRTSDSFAKDDKNAIEIGYKKQSSCLYKFLDGPQYSKEIKIESGLIKNGLVKYAGFDFNRGTKYAITTKGLEVLRKASEVEHNEVLNEREKLAYLFGFNTDEVSTLDTTGKVLKQATSKKWTICEADGTELGEVVADSELDAKVKFGIEHPEYADSQSISAKEIDAKYEETTEQHLDYPNPSETPHEDIVLENHNGWVNTADQKRHPYTEEEKRLLPLFRLLNEYVARKEITLEETPDNQPGTVATGQAEVINDLEHKVKDLGFHCEPIAEITDNDYIGYDIYSLRIFYK